MVIPQKQTMSFVRYSYYCVTPVPKFFHCNPVSPSEKNANTPKHETRELVTPTIPDQLVAPIIPTDTWKVFLIILFRTLSVSFPSWVGKGWKDLSSKREGEWARRAEGRLDEQIRYELQFWRRAILRSDESSSTFST